MTKPAPPICMIKTMKGRVVTTRCGITAKPSECTSSESEVTCRFCKTRTQQKSEADEYAESFANIAPLTERPQ